MHGLASRTFSVAVGAAMILAGCGASGSPTGTPAGGGGGGGGGTAQPAGGGDVSGIDACSLLTTGEIQTALDVAVKPGVEQDSDGQVDCEWSPQDDTEAVSVGVTVATYDDVLWQNMAASDLAKPVSGFGEAAFSGYPHAGDLSIRSGGYMVTIGIVDFRANTARVDAADATFANLVLSRL